MTINDVGNVGIGNTSPLSPLQVGNATTTSSTGDASGSITVFGTGATKSDGGRPGMYHRALVGLGLWADASMSFQVNGSSGSPIDAMRITNTGNVGIRTTSPSAPLHIRDPASAGGWDELRFRGTSLWGDGLSTPSETAGTLYMTMNNCMFQQPHITPFSAGNNAIARWGRGGGVSTGRWWETGTYTDNKFGINLESIRTTGLTIDTNGNTGIGTTSPLERLDVRGRVYTNGENNGFICDEGGSKRVGLMKYFGFAGAITHGNGVRLDFGMANTNDLTTSTGFTPQMTIDTSGNVGINTTTPGSKLEVNGNIRASQGAAFTGVFTEDRRRQFVLTSEYPDIVIASRVLNSVHGGTLTFAAVDPNNAGSYQKFVFNQGAWGSRSAFLDIGFRGGVANPHDAINANDTTLTINGFNRRVGIRNINPVEALEVGGSIKCTEQYQGGQRVNWVNLNLFSGWANYGAGFNIAAYRRDITGRVHLKGLIRSGSGVICNLPSGFRPSGQELFTVHTGGGHGRIDIGIDGNVVFVAGNNAYVQLDGLSFTVFNF
jgi:hypothetical protein